MRFCDLPNDSFGRKAVAGIVSLVNVPTLGSRQIGYLTISDSLIKKNWIIY